LRSARPGLRRPAAASGACAAARTCRMSPLPHPSTLPSSPAPLTAPLHRARAEAILRCIKPKRASGGAVGTVTAARRPVREIRSPVDSSDGDPPRGSRRKHKTHNA
jgi:hypothetical protein